MHLEENRFMAGRIESYIHSDILTLNKGGSLVEVTCQTDFAARTEMFIAFAKKVARLTFAYQAGNWEQLIERCPELGAEREALRDALKEEVGLRRAVVFNLNEEVSVTSEIGEAEQA